MISVRRTLTACTAIGLAVAVSGCVRSDTNENVVVTDTEVAVELPDNPRVVALGWSDGEIALSLGVKPVAIYDWQGFGEETDGVGPWISDEFGDESPEIISAASTGDFNYQQIEELEPDLILNVRSKSDSAITDSLETIAPVVTAPDGTPDYAVNWKVQTELIAGALGKSDEATTLIEETETLQQKIKDDNPDFADKTFVWGVKFGEAYGAYLPGDARFDTFSELGFVENPPVAALQTQGFFASVPAEQVAALDSDVAVFSTIGKPLAELESDNLINTLPVIVDGRAILLAEDDPIVQALGAGTPVSLKFALEGIEPQLVEVVSRGN